MLPNNYADEHVRAMFSPFGPLEEIHIHRDEVITLPFHTLQLACTALTPSQLYKGKVSKGCAFVKFRLWSDAMEVSLNYTV